MNNDKKKKRKGAVWVEAQTLSHPESGLAVVIKERTRGPAAFSWQIIHIESDGGRSRYVPANLPGLSDLKAEDGTQIQAEDVVFSLVKAARENISERMEKAKKTFKDKKDKDKKPRKERKVQGGLSTLAKQDAEAKGHEYKGPSERKKEKRARAKSPS